MDFTNGWTGGQYSLFRVLLAVGLLVQLGLLAPYLVHAVAPAILLLAAVFVSVPLAIGYHDRVAALALTAVLAGLGVLAASAVPSLVVTGAALLFHAGAPSAPFGSWAARGRLDPGAGWSLPPSRYVTAWGLLLAAQLITDLPLWLTSGGPLSPQAAPLLASVLLAIPAVLVRPARLGVWCLLVVFTALRTPSVDHLLALGFLHLLTFDPGWVAPRRGPTEMLFYDGLCGLCHRAARLVLAEDRTGAAFRFAPLQGDAFAAAVSEEERGRLPDSIVIQREDGRLLVCSSAILHILSRLGGLWRLVGAVGWCVPAPLRDLAYRGFARIRRRLFAPPAEACPLLPPHLRERFTW